MFIAHLPAGYILSKLVIKRDAVYQRSLLGVALVCSVAPDVDLSYFYFVDQRQHADHEYITHTPIFWLALAGLLTFALIACRKSGWLIFVAIGLLSILLHLAMDTVAADIRGLYPFSNHSFNLVQVPALYQPWYLNRVSLDVLDRVGNLPRGNGGVCERHIAEEAAAEICATVDD